MKKLTQSIVYLGVYLEVDFFYYPACRGHRDKYGAPEEPDEDASIELDTVKTESGDDITSMLSVDQIAGIEAAVMECDNEPDAPEPPEDW